MIEAISVEYGGNWFFYTRDTIHSRVHELDRRVDNLNSGTLRTISLNLTSRLPLIWKPWSVENKLTVCKLNYPKLRFLPPSTIFAFLQSDAVKKLVIDLLSAAESTDTASTIWRWR